MAYVLAINKTSSGYRGRARKFTDPCISYTVRWTNGVERIPRKHVHMEKESADLRTALKMHSKTDAGEIGSISLLTDLFCTLRTFVCKIAEETDCQLCNSIEIFVFSRTPTSVSAHGQTVGSFDLKFPRSPTNTVWIRLCITCRRLSHERHTNRH